MRYLIFIISLLFTIGSQVKGQSNINCGTAAAFCSGSTSQYPAGSGSTGNPPTLPPGSYLGCLGSAPYPAFFTIPVTQTGNLSMVLSAANDIDFIAFGPFNSANPNGNGTNPGGYCSNLVAANQVPNVSGVSNGCSFSGSNTETLVIPNAVAGDFYVLIITNYSQNAQQITVSPSGSGQIGGMTISGTPSVCAGKTGSATVNAGANIQSVFWSGPNGIAGTNYTQHFPNLQTTTIFTLTGISVTGQSCTATHQIIVQPTPTLVITNNSPICTNGTASFTAVGANDFSWTGPGYSYQNTSTISLVTINNAQPSNAGVYTVVGTVGSCSSQATSAMIVKPNPTVTVSRGGDFCFGKSFYLTSNGATTYTWTGPGSFYFQGQNPLFINNNFSMSGNYQVTGAVNGCTNTGVVTVSVNPLPNVTAVSSGSICQTASVSLTAGGASTYSWSGPSNFSSQQATVVIQSGMAAINNGTYTVIGKDANGCVNTATVFQAVKPNPYPNIYSMDACITKNLLLSSDGGETYQWSGPQNFSSNVQNPVILNASLLNSGVYNVTVTSAYGCSSTASVQAEVFLNPDVQVLGSREVCKDQVFHFSSSGAINYKWLNSTGIVTESPNFTISSSSPDLQRTYTLVGTDGHFCSTYIPFYPVVNQKPMARIVPDLQKSCTPFCTMITLNPLSTNITDYSWKFSDKSAAPGQTDHYSKCFTTPGITTVSVSLTDAKGCTNVITQAIEALVTPKADFVHTPDKPTPNDNQVTFMDATNNTDVTSWSWNFYKDERGFAKDTSEQRETTLTYKDVGNYLVFLKVTAANGCTDSISKLLILAEDPTFFIPNAFTPNGDGLNDIFIPKSVAVAVYQMDIFNRWGKLVFSTTDPAKGWDGKANGGDVSPADTYIYKFSVTGFDKNPKQYTGQFSLIK